MKVSYKNIIIVAVIPSGNTKAQPKLRCQYAIICVIIMFQEGDFACQNPSISFL